jgi:hypothetical protein
VMLGVVSPSTDELVETLNRDTVPTLLAIVKRFLCFGWKWRSKTAYGTAILWTWDLCNVSYGPNRQLHKMCNFEHDLQCFADRI